MLKVSTERTRVILVVVQVGAMKIYVAASSGGGAQEKKRKYRMKLS
jgi:hypothetical protein